MLEFWSNLDFLQFFLITISYASWYCSYFSYLEYYWLLCTALCRVRCTFSRRFTLHISTIWTGRVASGSPCPSTFLTLCIRMSGATYICNVCKFDGIICTSSIFSLGSNIYFFDDRQAFARLSAVYGGTYMLNKPECKVSLWFILMIASFVLQT